ncbi:MAG: sigma-70 family RNA polymerase sigma factor [Bryobacterales bacterium]|nr:sigma-70 family RNA polymerase sigma factor [Bryobacterales bacterium]
MDSSPSEVTELIRLAEAGTPGARVRLFEVLYTDLRRLAAARMQYERGGHTLSATALVHEAYLRLMGGGEPACRDRGHFFAVASQAMRRILVDHARARKSAKRGGGQAAPLDAADIVATPPPDDQLLAIDEALRRLQQLSPRQCQVVELRYFAGLTEDQAAEVLGVTRRTVNRDWRMARAWLSSRLAEAAEEP